MGSGHLAIIATDEASHVHTSQSPLSRSSDPAHTSHTAKYTVVENNFIYSRICATSTALFPAFVIPFLNIRYVALHHSNDPTVPYTLVREYNSIILPRSWSSYQISSTSCYSIPVSRTCMMSLERYPTKCRTNLCFPTGDTGVEVMRSSLSRTDAKTLAS